MKPKLTAQTRLAIEAFETHERKKHQMERSELALTRAVERFPSGELNAYTIATEDLREQIASRCRICQRGG